MKHKILFIDDDKAILDSFKILLEGEGFEVETDVSGHSVHELIKRTVKPDLILMDVLLADSDGRELTRYIKDTDELKHIPVIMLSAHSGLSDMVDNFGNEDFLEKPFDANTLIERIHKLLNATNNA